MKQAEVSAVAVNIRRHELLGGLMACSPRESFENGLFETPFPAFPRSEVINREGLLSHLNAHKNLNI